MLVDVYLLISQWSIERQSLESCFVAKMLKMLWVDHLCWPDDGVFQQPTWRLWGEERVDGAVYTVYLKKVRYHRPTRSASSVSISKVAMRNKN